jgi:hypothetical protein
MPLFAKFHLLSIVLGVLVIVNFAFKKIERLGLGAYFWLWMNSSSHFDAECDAVEFA